MAKHITKAKLNKAIGAAKAKIKNVTKRMAKPQPPKEEVPAKIPNPKEILTALEDRAWVALRIEDHLHAIAAEILDSGTSRKDRMDLYYEFQRMLRLAPVAVRAKVVEELEFMLKDPEPVGMEPNDLGGLGVATIAGLGDALNIRVNTSQPEAILP